MPPDGASEPPGRSWTKSGGFFVNLDLESNLYDLCGWHAEIGSWEIGVEVHRREERLSPDGHAWRLTSWNHHHPPGVIGDLFGVDASQAGIATGAFQPYHHMGNFHESEAQDNPGYPGADRDELYPPVGIDVRRIRVDDGDQQYALMQHPIVLQVMRQAERDS